ncbi:MAG: hypothetical protein IKN55_03725 [Oscillospiraceae bacterium]|nr:hypothetical protein [Oscillospiraceae bacterium]
MKNFFIILGAVFLILILLVIFGGKQTRRKIFSFFVEEVEETPFRPDPNEKSTRRRPQNTGSKGTRRNQNQAITEMAILAQKIDERRRVVDSTGHSKIYDEYFELVFTTRKGETLRLVTSRAAFKEVPFNQEGALTHKKGMLLKFKYHGGVITDDCSPLQSNP